jgi:hypothetical protein
VAGDHVDVVDPEVGGHLRRGFDAGAEDRPRGDVSFELGVEEAVEAADRQREAGAGAAGADGGLPLFSGQHLPGPLEGSVAPAPDRHHLGEAVGESI